MTLDALIDVAREARLRARAPYSGFLVGAAVEDADGRAFGGCNIESASYGLTVCAERTALFRAVAEGAATIRRVVVVTEAARLTPPCGACRQVLWDLCGDAEIVLVNLGSGERLTYRLNELFPHPFDANSLD